MRPVGGVAAGVQIGNGRTMTPPAFAALVAFRFLLLLAMTIGPTLILRQRSAAVLSAVLIAFVGPYLELLLGFLFRRGGMINKPDPPA